MKTRDCGRGLDRSRNTPSHECLGDELLIPAMRLGLCRGAGYQRAGMQAHMIEDIGDMDKTFMGFSCPEEQIVILRSVVLRPQPPQRLEQGAANGDGMVDVVGG